MSRETRWVGAVFVASLVGVQFGGTVLLGKLTGDPAYGASVLHQDLWRAGHAHAGQFLLLALVLLPWIDAARLSGAGRWYVRIAVSSASIIFPLAFFLGAPTPEVTEPRPMLGLIWPGAAVLASGLLLLTWGLLRRAPD